MENALISLGRKEIDEMIEEDGQADLVCHFCNKSYHFTELELSLLIEKKSSVLS